MTGEARLPEIDTTYESYAADPLYVAVNQALVDTIDLAGVARVADLACGTGLLTGLLLARQPGLAVCCIDLDPQQIAIARRQLGPGRILLDTLPAWRAAAPDAGAGDAALHLRVESVTQLPFADAELDLAVMANAIHMMPDRPAFLAEVRRTLRAGGAFVFNSAFYAGSLAPGTEAFYTAWLKEALAHLETINLERAGQGLPPVPRRRGTVAPAFSRGWLTPAAWREALEAAGFRVQRLYQRAMPLTCEGLKRVAAYGGLAEVLMSGYPLEVSSVCLAAGADVAFAAFGLTEVPRNWLEVTAVRA